MPRWYAARRCTGKPDIVAQQVKRLVETHDLRRVLTGIRFERRPRGQFYLFLAIESDTPGQLPQELLVLREHPVIKELMPHPDGTGVQPFTLEQIHKMVTGEVSVHDYARRLFTATCDPPVFAEPFPPDEAVDEAEVNDLLSRSQRYDRLIAWMSAAGGGSLAIAQRACRALGLDADGAETGRILRRLQLLGHVERSADGTRWSVAPLVLAQVPGPSGEPGYVLCGERDPVVLSVLRRAASVIEEPQPHGDGPARVFIMTSNVECLLRELNGSGTVHGARVDSVAARLAAALPLLEHWMDSLSPIPEVKPELYDVRRYRDGEFLEAVVEGSGFYELWPRDAGGPRARRPVARLFYDDARDRWLAGDWYGLRYLALVHEGRSCPAHYDVFSGQLAIPNAWRPPALYERALVLCSGRLPERRGAWIYYDDVQPAVLTHLTAKLHLSLQETMPHA